MEIGTLMDPRKTFGKAVTDLAEENQDIIVLSADSGKSSGFADFIAKYPERYFECGIMEQGVVGFAAGAATTGKIPVFCAIAPFVTGRPYEMVRNDVGYMKQNVKIVGRNCGFTYSDLGPTHQGLDDFGLMRLIPGVTILAPQDGLEIIGAVKAMIEHNGPVYMRIGNPKIPVLFEEKEFVIGKGQKLHEGSDITLITTGSTTKDALEAVKMLEEEGIQVDHLGMPTVVPLDTELVLESAKKTGKVLVAEEHYVDGGLGSVVSDALSEETGIAVRRHGIPLKYGTNGSYAELLDYYQLDAKGLAAQVKAFLNK